MLLRRNFPRAGRFQLPVLSIGSLSLDGWMNLLAPLSREGYLAQLLLLTAGIVVLAVGIAVKVAPNILYLPGEGLVAALATVSGVPFARAKVIFDIVSVTSVTILSLVLTGGIDGLREGTVISAIAVGYIAEWVLPPLRRAVSRLPR